MRSSKAMSAILAGAAGMATVLIAVAMVMLASSQSTATPAIAQKTSQPCAKCHSAPPALNDYGKKYKETLKK